MAEVVVLTGFMGVGKSATGRALARLLGWEFVDLDDAIETSAGKTVAGIFDEEGEERFRDRETECLRALLARTRIVLAAGGGLLLRAENRDLLRRALSINLDASFDECLRRVRGSSTVRPLLGGPDPEGRARALFAAREALYAAVAEHVETGGRSPDEVAHEIAHRFFGKPP